MFRGPVRKATAVVGVGAVTFATVRMMSSPSTPKDTLSSSAFNATQDAALITAYMGELKKYQASAANTLKASQEEFLSAFSGAEYLARIKNKEPVPQPLEKSHSGPLPFVTLYELLSCPYCAKVKAVLDFHGVPYGTRIVDPLSMQPLPAHSDKYPFVPQLEIPNVVDKASDKKSYIVDSGDIVEALAEPLGYSKQLLDPEVKQMRSWINDAYIKATFVAMCGTWSSAYEAYPNFVRRNSIYQSTVARWIGSAALTWMCSMRVKKLKAEGTLGSEEPFDAFIYRQFNVFISSFPNPDAPFHGGAQPDIVDMEMFGVTRALLENSQLQGAFMDGDKVQSWVYLMIYLSPRNYSKK